MADNKGTDQEYLLNEQYKDSSNLRARIHIHRQYSTNTYGWTRWVFDYLKLSPPNARILEIGCGPCDLWLQNLNRIPDEWEIFLSDLSPGMIEKAKDLLFDRAQRFTFQEFDAQSIPHEDDSLDTVIANHMLYHVPALDKALNEIQRILKPTGRLFAATNGSGHMQELPRLRDKFLQSIGVEPEKTVHDGVSWALGFNLENGEEILSAYFPHIILRRYVDSLRVTSTRALHDHMMSGRNAVDDELSAEYYEFLQTEMDASGGMIAIEKETGMFQAWAEDSPLPENKHSFTFIADEPGIELAKSPIKIEIDHDDDDDDDTTTTVQKVR